MKRRFKLLVVKWVLKILLHLTRWLYSKGDPEPVGQEPVSQASTQAEAIPTPDPLRVGDQRPVGKIFPKGIAEVLTRGGFLVAQDIKDADEFQILERCKEIGPATAIKIVEWVWL